MNKGAGILLAVSSLPSEYGIGCFCDSAYKFIEWLNDSGQKYWQILPIGQTGYGDSPYQSFSTFAGNPYFISLKKIMDKGLLSKEECDSMEWGRTENSIDYALLYKNRYSVLRKAFERSNINNDDEYLKFCNDNKWLEDYSLFMALKDKFGGVAYSEWDDDIKLRDNEALESYRKRLDNEMAFYKFLQFEFFKQWGDLKKYANEKGIKIIGDIPIYVSADSADAWANPKLFQLDENNIPVAVAGCPPDSFSEDGQLWGNPLYDWEEHEKSHYEWWQKRLEHCFSLYDIVRIDHFRGFDEYYSIPYGSENAVNGHWEKGPGMKLFNAVKEAFDEKEIIAEDLGFITESVKELVQKSGLPNMNVLEFAFDSRDTGDSNDYLPHNYTENSVAYTGTHDNQTLKSWYKTITNDEKIKVRDYLCDYSTADDNLNIGLIALLMRSNSKICIIPMQDWLELDDNARMNTPSTVGDNWKWRMKDDDLNEALSKKISKITRQFGR